jgi:hypothetical protein
MPQLLYKQYAFSPYSVNPMAWGPVHYRTAEGFACGVISISYVMGWLFPYLPPSFSGWVYIIICTVIVLATTIAPALVLFGLIPAPSGEWWAFTNGFGAGVALMLLLVALYYRQPIIPIPTNSTTTTTTTTFG